MSDKRTAQRLADWVASHGVAVAVVKLDAGWACIWYVSYTQQTSEGLVDGWEFQSVYSKAEARVVLGY